MTKNRTFHAGKVTPRADITETSTAEKCRHIAGLPGTDLEDDLALGFQQVGKLRYDRAISIQPVGTAGKRRHRVESDDFRRQGLDLPFGDIGRV